MEKRKGNRKIKIAFDQEVVRKLLRTKAPGEAKAFTHKEFCKRHGIAYETFKGCMRTNHEIVPDYLTIISQVYDVSVEALTGEVPTKSLEKELSRLKYTHEFLSQESDFDEEAYRKMLEIQYFITADGTLVPRSGKREKDDAVRTAQELFDSIVRIEYADNLQPFTEINRDSKFYTSFYLFVRASIPAFLKDEYGIVIE